MNKKIILGTIVTVMLFLLVISLVLMKNEQTQTIEQVKEKYESELMAINGVVGVGVGECEGKPCIKVFLKNDSLDLKKQIPTQLDGFRVDTEVTGPIFITTTLGEESMTERFDRIINKMVSAINSEDYEGIHQDFSKIMLKAFPLKKSKPFFKDLLINYGKIKKIGSIRFIPPDQAIYPAYFEQGRLDIKIVLDNDDKIIGLWFLPHTPDIFVPENHKTVLSLPFKGRWFVVWGGDKKELNQHYDDPCQRYAFDFDGVDENGNTHKGEGTKNQDYFAFGREILAPADGIVTDVIDGVRDNVPGSMNPYSALGNAVFIQHQEYEVSVFAHLKYNSIKVKVGDKVKRGQVIGLCGNSGNSSEPHLHFHLQNTSIIQDGTGIKCYFQKVILLKDGKKKIKDNYSPIKGDIIISE